MKIFTQKVRAGLLLVAVFIAAFAGILYMAGGSSGSSRILAQRDGKHTEYVETLYSLRVTDSSDLQGIRELLCQMIDEVFQYHGMNEDMEPFTVSAEGDLLKIQYQENINRPDSFRRLTADYSAVLLALIPDIKQIEWQYAEIQYGGKAETKSIQYDWAMMQKQDFTDSAICEITKNADAGDFGTSASALQMLVEHFTYYDKGKLPEKNKPALVVDEEQMRKELKELPASYSEAAQCKNIYVEGAAHVSAEEKKEGYNRKIWDEFYQITQKGQAASVIVGAYNSSDNAALDQTGSVYYGYIYYDGIQYHFLNDFIDSDGSHDFEEGVQSGKYLLESDSDINNIAMTNYFITDNASLSWRDVTYSMLYAGINEYTPIDAATVNLVLSEFR